MTRGEAGTDLPPRAAQLRVGDDSVGERIESTLLHAGLVLAVLVVVSQTSAHLVTGLVFDNRYSRLDAGEENNVWAWASVVATFSVALLAFVHALVWVGHRLRWVGLAAVTAFLSLDDDVQIHEPAGARLARLVSLPEEFHGRLFVVLYAPLLLGTLAMLWWISRNLSKRSSRVLRIGVVMLCAATFAEVAWAAFTVGGGELNTGPDDLQVALEEGLEVGGWILIAAAVAVKVVGSLVRDEPEASY